MKVKVTIRVDDIEDCERYVEASFERCELEKVLADESMGIARAVAMEFKNLFGEQSAQ